MIRCLLHCLLLISTFKHTNCTCSRSYSQVSDGLFHMVGLFPIHSEDIDGLNPNAVLWAEYFRYTIENLNKKYPRTPSSKLFGYKIYDTCSEEQTKAITSTAMDILLNDKKSKKNEQCFCLSKNIPLYENLGIVGPLSSENSLYFNSLFSHERVPQVSYAATSMELTNINSFYRTVPNDLKQAHFIKDLLLKFNWTYVSILTSDDMYGRSGDSVLSNVFKQAGICVSTRITFNIRQKTSVESAIKKLELLKEEKLSKVIIVWSFGEAVERFMVKASDHNLCEFAWIISEATGLTNFFGSPRNHLSGTFLSVVHNDGRDEKFEEYFNNYTYEDSIPNNWMRNVFHKYSIKSNNTAIKDLAFRFDFSHIGYVHDAISVLYEAFIMYIKSTVPCPLTNPNCQTFGIINHEEFNEKFVSKVSFKRLNGDSFSFDRNGESTTAKYNLYITKKNSKGVIADFKKIINWESVDNKTPQIYVTNESLIRHLRNLISKCAEDCTPGFYPIFDRTTQCCWHCLKCGENHVKNTTGQYPCTKCPYNTAPNENKTQCLPLTELYLRWSDWQAIILYIISVLGIALVLGTALIFKTYDHTPIIRSSNFILSNIQLIAHLLIFLTPILFIGTKDTINRCAARACSTGLLLTLVTCVSFVKVTQLLNLFNFNRKMTKKEIVQYKTREMASLLCLLLISVSIAVGMLVVFPVETNRTLILESYSFYENCNIYRHYLAQLAYLLLMQIACAVQAFRGRKLPGRFNEAQYTFFAMFTSTLLMAISVPLVQSADNQKKENFVISIITLVVNLCIMVILYGYKIKLIIFYPEENTIEVFQRDRQNMNHPAARRVSFQWRN